mgnify:CR=1 FL=1
MLEGLTSHIWWKSLIMEFISDFKEFWSSIWNGHFECIVLINCSHSIIFDSWEFSCKQFLHFLLNFLTIWSSVSWNYIHYSLNFLNLQTNRHVFPIFILTFSKQINNSVLSKLVIMSIKPKESQRSIRI